jgi:hypothetical protein
LSIYAEFIVPSGDVVVMPGYTANYPYIIYSGNGVPEYNPGAYSVTEITMSAPTIGVNFTFAQISFTYDGAAQGPVPAPSPTIPSSDYSTSGNSATNVGSYTATATATASGYSGSSSKGWSISKAPLTITAAAESSNFGQAIPSLLYSMSGLQGSDTSSVVSGASASTTATSISSPGAYTITMSGGTASNYSITDVNGTLTISKTTPTGSLAAETHTYGTALSSSDLSATFSNPYGGSEAAPTGTVTYSAGGYGAISVGTVLPAGTYTVTASYPGNTNYNAATTTATFTINKAVLTVTATGASTTYTGTGYSGGNGVTITGWQNGDTSSVLGTGSFAYTGTSQGAIHPGSYAITPGGFTAANYTLTYVSGTLTISKATPTVSWTAPAAITYGIALSATQLDATASVPGTFAYSPVSGTVLGAGVGQTLSVTLTPTDTTDYNSASGSTTITVNPAAATYTISPISFTYSAAAQGPSVTPAPAGATPTVTGTSSATAAGSYSVTATASGNYTGANTQAWTIAKAPLTITAAAESSNFGQAIPSLLYSISGLQGSDTSSVVSGASASTTATSISSPGAYTITMSGGTASNYSITDVNGTLTISKTTPTGSLAAETHTYGTALSSSDLSASFSNPYGGSEAAPTGTVTYSAGGYGAISVGTVLPAGTYTVTASYPGDANYNATTTTATFTINKAVLTVTATGASTTYTGTGYSGGNGVTITGWQNGDTSSVLGTGSFAYTGTSQGAIHPGTYAITPGGFTAANYTLTYVSGTLTISKATPTVTWTAPAAITYGTALSASQLDATGSAPGTYVYSPVSGTVLGAGVGQTLSVTLTPTDTTDYNSASGTTTITVNPAPASYTISPTAFTYTAAAQGPTVTPTPAGATPTITGTSSATAAGAYSVTATASGNYTGSNTQAWTIAKATPTVTWTAPAAITYGTALSATQLDATASVPGTFAYSPASGTVLGAGAGQTLSVTFTPTDTTDYSTATGSTTITVNAAAATYTISPTSFTYTAAAQGPTVTPSPAGATPTITGTGSATAAGSYSVTATASGNYTGAKTQAWTIAKATPTITWAAPTAITYGAAISATQLDATASVPGTFAYSPASGTVLGAGAAQTLSVTFTPTDTTDYNTATQTALLTVNAAPLTITANNQSKVFGAALPSLTAVSSGFVNGDSSSVLSGLVTSTTGTASSPVGSYPITASGATASNYSISFVAGTLTISKATPVITWAAPSAITYGIALSGTQLDATANTAGTFVYSPASGTVLSLGAGQTLSVAFTPTDTTDYNSASGSTTITVNQGIQSTVTLVANPSTIVMGNTSTLTASGGSGTGAFVYGIQSGPGTIVGNVVTATGGGTIIATAYKAADTNYGVSNTATATITATGVKPSLVALVNVPYPTAIFPGDPADVAVTASTSDGVTPISAIQVQVTGPNGFTYSQSWAPNSPAASPTTSTFTLPSDLVHLPAAYQSSSSNAGYSPSSGVGQYTATITATTVAGTSSQTVTFNVVQQYYPESISLQSVPPADWHAKFFTASPQQQLTIWESIQR